MIDISKAKLLCLAACLMWAVPLTAEQPPRAELITAHRIGTTPPMASYLATHHPVPHAPVRVFPLRKPGSHPGKGGNKGGNGGGSGWTDPALQTNSISGDSFKGSSEFKGIGADGYVPPDTNISVGDTQIVETVNVDYAVYDKSGHILPAGAKPAPISSIFAAVSGSSMCSQVDGGDPIVLYDKIDNRWIISQLAYNNGFSNNHLCLAISNSSDATGSYTTFDVSFGKNLPDYPKLGIWTNGNGSKGTAWNNTAAEAGVYFSANMFAHGSSFIGAQMCSFPLSVVANPKLQMTWNCVQNGTGVYSILPADLEGSQYAANGTTLPPPPNTPEYFMQFSGSNTLSLYQFDPGFTSGKPTVSGPINVGYVKAFQEACGGGSCIPQLGTSTQLDSLGDRLMYRLSYRNYPVTSSNPSAYQSMVVTQSVQMDSTSNATGIRWYQVENTGNGWNVAQQGTFGASQNDGNYRWMGSIAQDKVGDLGLGYSVSGPQMDPTIAYTGQTPAEASTNPGEMEPEFVPNATLGQSGWQSSVNRWGDYSSMSVDPSDDCTMWYANEYLSSPGSYTNWGTYITSFKFGNCQ